MTLETCTSAGADVCGNHVLLPLAQTNSGWFWLTDRNVSSSISVPSSSRKMSTESLSLISSFFLAANGKYALDFQYGQWEYTQKSIFSSRYTILLLCKFFQQNNEL